MVHVRDEARASPERPKQRTSRHKRHNSAPDDDAAFFDPRAAVSAKQPFQAGGGEGGGGGGKGFEGSGVPLRAKPLSASADVSGGKKAKPGAGQAVGHTNSNSKSAQGLLSMLVGLALRGVVTREHDFGSLAQAARQAHTHRSHADLLP